MKRRKLINRGRELVHSLKNLRRTTNAAAWSTFILEAVFGSVLRRQNKIHKETHFGHPTPSVGETLKLPSDLFSTVVCSSKRRSKRRNLWRRRRRRHVGTAESVIPPWARRILFPRPPRPLPGPTEGLQQFGGLTHCDQIGQVWKVLGDNFLIIVAQVFGDFLGCF